MQDGTNTFALYGASGYEKEDTLMNVRRPIWPVIWLFAMLVWVPVQMQAQVAVTATVTGFVTDPSGALVPGAAVTIVNTHTGFTRSSETSTEGGYKFPGLPIGTYELSVTKAGFQTYKQTGITLQVNQTARQDVALQVGGVTQAIEVVAQATLLQTETSSQGQVVEQRRLADLPLDGRNPIALVALVAGATVVNAPAILEGYRNGAWASVNGSRINQNNFLFDGNNYSCVYANTGLNYPNPDALQEFKLITHNYAAEFGRNVGSVFNAVTKSGTNQFHGSAWEFLRNDALNARNFFADKVSMLRQNQFGVTAGGPIVKNKLFIFGSYQAFRIKQESLLADAVVATAAERTGDFSASGTTIIDPETGQQFPGNIIPEDRLSPISTTWYNKYVPLPNNPDGRSITYMEGNPKRVDQVLLKVDWQISSKQTLSGRWFRDKSSINMPFQASIPKYATTAFGIPTQDGSLNHTYSISPTLLNQAHVGVSHTFFHNDMAPDSLGWEVTNSSMGINMPDMRPYSPSMSIGDNVGVGFNAEVESGLSHQYSDTLTWIRGKHTFKFGMEVLVDDYHNRSYFLMGGQFNFDGSFTGSGMADFLLGRTSYVEHHGAYFVDSNSKKYYSFISDDWKVSPRLTLNLGFRYELNQPVVDNSPGSFPNQQATYSRGQQSTLFPDAPVGLVFPGDPGIPAGLYTFPKWNLEPRLGFAWDPTGAGKWAIRGAVGMFSDIPFMDVIGGSHANQPYTLVTRVYSPAGGFADPYRDWPGGNPWPDGFDPANVSFVTPAAIQAVTLDFQDPRVTQYNLSIQRTVGTDWMFDVSFVGSSGRHLLQGLQANPAHYIPGNDAGGNPLSTPENVDSRREDSPGTLSSVYVGASVANSSYNALQFTIQKRMSKSLTVLSSYTWSHSIDNSSTTTYGGTNNADPFNYGPGEKGSSDTDKRHVYSLSSLYDLPKFTSRGWAMRNVLGGWGIAGIFIAGAGTPWNPWTGNDNNLDGDWPDRPNQVGSPYAVDRSTRALAREHWINTAAFVENPIGTSGNVGRNALYAPGTWNVDFSILRDFVISEKYGRFQFRSEFFNIANNPNLGCPRTNLQSGNFGKLMCAGSPRLIQFGLKYLW